MATINWRQTIAKQRQKFKIGNHPQTFNLHPGAVGWVDLHLGHQCRRDRIALSQEGSPVKLIELDGYEVKVHHIEARDFNLIAILFRSIWLVEGKQRDRVGIATG